MAFMELLKFPARSSFPATGDNNRLYVDLHSKRIYYWDRGAYQIASPDIVEQGSNPISEAFSYGGIVATVALLPTEGIRIGDVYIVEQDEGHEQNSAYVWSGTQWIEIGGDMEHLVAISWADLKALRDEGELVPGAQYRITDYTCTTTQENTQSADHPFDIIVVADSVDKLNETARACLHAGDTYFANSKLEAWKLKYCLDNDVNRFAWADEVNGKGVIYRMIDEFNNDIPYDFKNIQFNRKLTDGELDLDSGTDTWVYTFTLSDLIEGEVVDISLKQNTEYPDDEQQYKECANNVIKEAILEYQPDGLIRTQLNDNVFLNIFDDNVSYSYYGCCNNTFGNNCYSNTFSDSCYSNTFSDSCYSNTFTYGCSHNTFGNGCYSNTFGERCYSNTFGEHCYSNTFGDGCEYNTFGNDCYNNTFGNSCNSNTFGNDFQSNTFGNDCYNNTFGNDCYNNTFGNSCNSNTFGNGCKYLQISDSSSTQKRYISVENGLTGASGANKFDLFDSAILNKNYQVTFKKSESGKYLMLWATDTGTMTGKVKATNTTATWSDIV